MIHYHGTPISPRHKLLHMKGRHFCVSFAEPRDVEVCLEIGQSVMFDNGAYTMFTKGKQIDWDAYVAWVERYVVHPHWAVIPDVIGGREDEQRQYLSGWTFPKELSAPVWHLGLSIDWLLELADNYPKICFGSSEQYWQVGSELWQRRMDEAFEALARTRRHLPWIHGMRMLGQTGGRFPLSSADSTNVARNHNSRADSPEDMAQRIDAIQTPGRWQPAAQYELL